MPLVLPDNSFVGGNNYLNTSNYGLFTNDAVTLIQSTARQLGDGTFDTATRDEAVESSRQYFADIIGAKNLANISTGCSGSPYVGLIANSLADGSKVLIAEDDFTSLTMPFAIHRDRLEIVEVPLDEFIDTLDETFDWAAVSVVQSADGRIIDLDSLAQKRITTSTKVLVDATQSAGWLPMNAESFDMVVCAAYKWLLCPRGVSFAYFSQELIDTITPINIGWYASDDSHSAYYGTDMSISPTARKFDISPTGINWIGAEPSLRLLVETGIENIHQHNVGLANLFRDKLSIPESNSAIVTTRIDEKTISLLGDKDIQFGIQEGSRTGFARFSFHLYNDENDALLAASCFE